MGKLAIVGTVVAALIIGFGAGIASASAGDGPSRPRSPVTSSVAAGASDLSPQCRSALTVGGQAIGSALQGLGSAQSALRSNAGSTQAANVAPGLLSQASAQVQSMLTQYDSARGACESAARR